MWYRVFAAAAADIPPADLLEHLQRLGHKVVGRFRGDERGWFSAELDLPGEQMPLDLQRYFADEKGIRDELNTWAAWLETQADSLHRDNLMRRVIQSRQVFTILRPSELDEAADDACRQACVFLARSTDGVYQIDDQGFFAADESLLVAEPPSLTSENRR